MSEYQKHDNDDVPRFEPWLAVMSSSLVPAALILFVPSLMVPLVATTVLLFAGGIVMFRSASNRPRQEVES